MATATTEPGEPHTGELFTVLTGCPRRGPLAAEPPPPPRLRAARAGDPVARPKRSGERSGPCSLGRVWQPFRWAGMAKPREKRDRREQPHRTARQDTGQRQTRGNLLGDAATIDSSAASGAVFQLNTDTTMSETSITLSLTEAEAIALAQFLKRCSFSDYQARATSDDDAYMMQGAAVKVREALATKGVNPR